MATYDLTSTTPSVDLLVAGDILNCPYSGTYKSISLPNGVYKLECWGAQGGYRSSSTYGGKGAYTSGNLSLETTTTLYLYAGGSGQSTTVSNSIYPGGFNGGGYRYKYRGGGGASDIRINSTSLKARVMVAAGGGSDGATAKDGGVGGTLTGGVNLSSGCGSYGQGGTRNASTATGGLAYINTQGTTNSSANCAAGFGFGGFGGYTSSGYGGAGGGGWYGGEGVWPDDSADDEIGGGGGSSYIFTAARFSDYPSGCLLTSEHYIDAATYKGGAESFLSPTGTTETGHSGNGYVRITIIEMGNVVITTYDLASTSVPVSKIQAGKILNCSYTGTYKTVTLPIGTYKLECWGASGAGFSYTSNNESINVSGGKGGYSSGILTLSQETSLYLYTGGEGPTAINSTSGTIINGGFNGGGKGSWYNGSTQQLGQTGGGASDIRIGSNSLYARVIVAGGGGGANYYYGYNFSSWSYVTWVGTGGCGGGFTSGDGTSDSSSNLPGLGGTQSAVGTSYSGTTANDTSKSDLGGFGQGANPLTTGVSGGGGGWYGGGSASNAGAGGGSGYVYTSSTASSYPSGCLLDENYYLTSDINEDGNSVFSSPEGSSETGHQGNGYIKITVIEAYQPVSGVPSLSNTIKNYNVTYQSPTETGYDSETMIRTGVITAILPGVYTVTYMLKSGYIWPDLSREPKSFTWQINSNWKKLQPWILDSSL